MEGLTQGFHAQYTPFYNSACCQKGMHFCIKNLQGTVLGLTSVID